MSAAASDPPRLWLAGLRTPRGVLGAILAVGALGAVCVFTVVGLRDDPTKFVVTGLNGVTSAGLLFTVASGFTLIFGLMRVVNLAHGSLYLLGAYVGWSVQDHTGSWYLACVGAAAAAAVAGLLLQQGLMRRMEGQDLRQALLTIGVSLVVADQLLARYGGLTYTLTTPSAFERPVDLHVASVTYPGYRLVILAVAIAVGAGLFALLKGTRAGMLVRAGVDDRAMVAALGINVQRIFAMVFVLGSALVGVAGVVGGSALSISPGEDDRYLLYSLLVVIVGGMGSIVGAAVGALLVGLINEYGLGYQPTYSIFFTFGLLIVVLALRPQGIMGRPA